MKYWVFKVNEETGGLYLRSGTEIYNHRMNDGFWGINDDPEKSQTAKQLQNLEKGDRVIFYLVEHGQESRFLGTATLDSSYEKLDSEKQAALVHKAFLDGDRGVFLKDIKKWDSPLMVGDLRGKGPFGDGRSKFSPFFQGTIRQLKSQEEYETIIREYELFSNLKKPSRRQNSQR